ALYKMQGIAAARWIRGTPAPHANLLLAALRRSSGPEDLERLLELDQYFAFRAAARIADVRDLGRVNYYLLKDARTGRWELIPHDLNDAFGLKSVDGHDLFSGIAGRHFAARIDAAVQDALRAHPPAAWARWLQAEAARIEPLVRARPPRRRSGRAPDARALLRDAAPRLLGNARAGSARAVGDCEVCPGSAVLWDVPERRPEAPAVEWQELEPKRALDFPGRTMRPGVVRRTVKRTFDILFAVCALALTLPLYPFIMLAIFLEDGWPFFFAHWRETRGGREFPCIKFRSMRRDAEKMKADLVAANEADGPQFFMDEDPRLTRIGRFLRKTQLDEIPQFVNVLLGHMSVVGPRPSPCSENQFCPGWREARLSVRPGVTGLWQVKRTRQKGLDFQEWIRFDIEYVERANLWLDLWIIWHTILVVLRGND
ncbi:MAG: sugar transferase, partial [Planctomycetota bacterium]